MTSPSIIVVEDDDVIRASIATYFENHAYNVATASSWENVYAILRRSRPEVAVVDYALPDGNALDALPRLQEASPDTAVVILTGHGSIDLAVRAIKEGAEHFLTKPVELDTLRILVERIMLNRTSRRLLSAGRTKRERLTRNPFPGDSGAIRQVEELARAVVDTDRTVLVLGETGVGKGLLARWLHDTSVRRDEPFVELNCSGLSRELLETELFGHEKGAFTGAVTSKLGLLEAADRGTLFLDEIGDVDPTIQPKLLKVIEEKTFRRVGGVRERRADVRLVAATHQDLHTAVEEGRFRADLYFRLSVFPITIPPLRERAEDIDAISKRLLAEISAELARPVPITLSDSAREALKSSPWPGNIRELRNVLERAVLLNQAPVLDCTDLLLGSRFADRRAIGDPLLSLAELEKLHIEAILTFENGNVDAAAQRLGVARSTIYSRIKSGAVRMSEIRTRES